MDILNEFDFNIEYIPGETNEFADSLSRIYSDEKEGVMRADSKYVKDFDEPIRTRSLRTHLIYIDSALISIMNAKVRQPSRLADKPKVNYKETRDRRKRVNKQEDSPAETETPPNEGDTETEPNAPIREEEPPRVNLQKHIKSANKLFSTMSTMERRFLDCLKGKYSEDPMFKGILNSPENFANFKIEEGLIFF